jgi:predicted CXXCH cytochrome family protein
MPVFGRIRFGVWLAALSCVAALPTNAEITGSAHDFSTEGWSGGQACVVCHTPHNAETSLTDTPLWNHEISVTSYTMYDSPTLTVKPLSQPQGTTKLCLSCHDGTVAIDSFGGGSGSILLSGTGNLMPDLSDDHPISLKWDHQNESPSCANCHNAHGQPFSTPLPFFNGYIECATCHDVHSATAEPTLLRLPLQGSQLCLHCHGR